jgi:endonuclease III
VVASPTPSDGRAKAAGPLARRLVARLGGRYSTEAGIDVDAGDGEVERWFVASTLFGTRISTAIAQRTFAVLDAAGLARIAQARDFSWDELVALLDEGGYARYDFRTATRLHAVADVIADRYGGRVTEIGHQHRSYPELRAALDDLPGWGPVTVEVFLRELRGVWPGAQPPPDPRAVRAARHLGLVTSTDTDQVLGELFAISRTAGMDLRDLESALVRLALVHRRELDACPGGDACTVLTVDGT